MAINLSKGIHTRKIFQMHINELKLIPNLKTGAVEYIVVYSEKKINLHFLIHELYFTASKIEFGNYIHQLTIPTMIIKSCTELSATRWKDGGSINEAFPNDLVELEILSEFQLNSNPARNQSFFNTLKELHYQTNLKDKKNKIFDYMKTLDLEYVKYILDPRNKHLFSYNFAPQIAEFIHMKLVFWYAEQLKV